MANLKIECIGGGHVYVGHGSDVVLLAFEAEVGWLRNSVGLTSDAARQLAARLVEQADRSDALTSEHKTSRSDAEATR